VGAGQAVGDRPEGQGLYLEEGVWMANSTMDSLRELQRIDQEVRKLKSEIEAFDPALAEVEEPALRLEGELGRHRTRLDQMRADARRLERGAEDKRERTARLEQRLTQVSNLREEAAVRTELDLVRGAIEAEEQEAMALYDQIQRAEVTLEELEGKTREAREAVEPNQESLLAERSAIQSRVGELQGRRGGLLEALGEAERKVYERFHQSGRQIVVAILTEDGACGGCYGMVPLQRQNEVRRGEQMIRCEFCGVILTADAESATP
jgi:uncharacterized protein